MSTRTEFETPLHPLAGDRIKAGFHCHSVNSDGGLSPADTVARYRAHGFHCLGITDHRQVTAVSEFAGDDLLVIAATENGGDPDVIGVGVNTAVPVELPLPERTAALARQGGFTIAAHPSYCAVLPHTYLTCPDLMAMEIYNAYCDAAYTNGYAVELWDMILGQGKRLWGVAGDDAHMNPKKRYYSDAGLAWVEIWSAARTETSVLEALKNGRFFSTQGPVFEQIEVNGPDIHIRCNPVCQVRWRTRGKVGYVEYAEPGAALTSARLPEWFRPSRYVRIELVDRDGKRAWSNPVFPITDEGA